MNQKKLLDSQKELLDIKVQQIKNIQQRENNMKIDFANTVARMKEELGIPKAEAKDWDFDKTEQYFVKKNIIKKPIKKFPKEKGKKK